jgi:hypothetical protein
VGVFRRRRRGGCADARERRGLCGGGRAPVFSGAGAGREASPSETDPMAQMIDEPGSREEMPSREALRVRLRKYRGALPKGVRFDREEANKRR